MRAATGSLERIEEQPDRLSFEISVDDSVIAEVSNATWSDAVWFFNHYSGELHRGALSSAHRVDLRVGGRVTAATEVSVGRSSPIGLSSSGGL